jgi:hypothetical protein
MSSSSTKLTRYVSATTIVTADVANMWYGGLYGSSDSYLYDSDSPLVVGHAHDGVHADGHAQKIHLVDHVADQITNPNVGTNAITPRTVNYYTLEENAIPYIDSDGMYKLNLSMITPAMGFGAFIEIEADNLIKHTSEDYSEDGTDFVFGSSSLDDIGIDPTPAVIEDGDCRFLFDRDKAAFRAGYVNLDQWDEFNRGWGSAALGSNSIASGAGSIALGTGHSVLGDFSSALGGHSNDIDIDSTYSVITGGYQNDISNSMHSFIACGHSNKITNSSASSIIAGSENYNGGTSSAVGGYGVSLPTGAGSFVWGYVDPAHTVAVVGSQQFIIGTGLVDYDEKYRLGVNTRSPHPAGDMGAHIVGSTDAGSSPLRLTNLTNNDSLDALCVDSDGNVFVSNNKLAPTSVDRVQIITFERYRPHTGYDSNSASDWRYRTAATSPAHGFAYASLANPWGYNTGTSIDKRLPALVFPYQGAEDGEGPCGTIRFSLLKGETLTGIVLYTDLDFQSSVVGIPTAIVWRLKVAKINVTGGGEHTYLAGGEENSYVLSGTPDMTDGPGWDGTDESKFGRVVFQPSNFGTIVGESHHIYVMTISPKKDDSLPAFDSRVYFAEVYTETSTDFGDFVSSPRVSSR